MTDIEENAESVIENADGQNADGVEPSRDNEQAGAGSRDEESSAGLEERAAALEKENTELKDQYLRKAADFENYRKRSIRERQDAIDFANASLLTDLIPIIDDFERAVKAAEDSSDASALKDGVVMIKDKLVSLLDSKYGLRAYESLDKPFDPNVHEALGKIPSPDANEPIVGEVYLKGYELKGRVVRAAKVMVKMPADGEQTDAAEDS